MQTRIVFTVNPTGAIPAVTTAGNQLYQGQVGTVDYRLEMLTAANPDNWRPTDVVLMRFTRPDARVNQQIMRYVDGGWELTSNGWETDVDISSADQLKVSFICKRYSTVDPSRLVADKTTQQVTLQLQPSAGYTPLNIADDDADEILEQLAQYNVDLLGVDTDLQEHKSKTDNPHGVTKAQVGLGSVKNVEQLTAADKAVPGGVASLDSAGQVPVAQVPQLPLDKLPATHQKMIKDFTVNSLTGVGTKYYTDGTTASVSYPIGSAEGGSANLINLITFEDSHFVDGEIAFTALQTGQVDNHYLAFLDRGDGEGFRQTANSVFKGSDGSALISGVAVPFDGRLLVIGAGAAVQFILNDMTGSSTTKAPSQAAVKAWGYSREQINQMLGGGGIALQVVETLPDAAEALPNIIYMLPIDVPEGANYYEEYLKVNGRLEIIGTTKVDLTPYATTESLNELALAVTNLPVPNYYFADDTTLTLYTDTDDGNKLKFRLKDTFLLALNNKVANTSNILIGDGAGNAVDSGIPASTILNTLSAVNPTGNPVNIQNTNDGFIDKIKIVNNSGASISSPLTGKSVNKNLFDISQTYEGGIFSVNGLLDRQQFFGSLVKTNQTLQITTTGAACGVVGTKFYPCIGGGTISVSTVQTFLSTARGTLVFYDENKTFISRYLGDVTTGKNEGIAIPANAHYFRESWRFEDAVTGVEITPQIEFNSTANDYVEHSETAFSIPLKDTSGTVLDLNPADVIEMVDGKYHLNSTELHDDSQDALRSIATKEGQTNLIGDQPFTFDVTEFQLGLESLDAMLTLPNGTRVNVITKDRLIFIASGEHKGKTLDYVLQEMQNDIDAKQPALTFDDAPTADSDNTVKSGGVYAMIQAIQAGQTLRTVLTFADTDFVNGAIELDSTATGLVNDTAQITVERAISGGYVQTANAVIKYSDGSIKLDGVSVPFSGRFVIIK